MPDTPFDLRSGSGNVGDFSDIQQGIKVNDRWENLIGTNFDDIDNARQGLHHHGG